MITRKSRKTLIIIVTISILLGFVQFSSVSMVVERNTFASEAESAADLEIMDEKLEELEQLMTYEQTGVFEPNFMDVNKAWEQQNIPDGTQTITVQGGDISDASHESSIQIGTFEGRENSLIWKPEETNWIEYEIEVAQGGLYEMVLDYYPYISEEERSFKPTVFAVAIDGEYQFREARAIEFERLFKDRTPLETDQLGDHIRPRPIEIANWLQKPFTDADSSYYYPLKWNFSAGKHTIRFQTFEPIIIDQFTLRQQVDVESYELVASRYPEGSSDAPIQELEAEFVDSKNEVSLQMLSDKDAMMSPESSANKIFNGIGGREWRTGGGMATWSFEVPESGRYKIALRTYQGYFSNKATFRKILIDGAVPFEEMIAFRFPYSKRWESTLLADEAGEAYEFYLEAGSHTISMEASYAPYNIVIKNEEKISNAIRDLSQDLNSMTGGIDDRNRTWNIVENFPEIPERLELVRDILKILAEELLRINGRQDNNTQSLTTSAQDIQDMLRHPNDIPYKLDNLSITQNKIGSIRNNLANIPLAIDRFYIAPVEQDFPRMKATVWERMRSGLTNFFHSFSDDRKLSYDEEEVLNVWMFMGRDYVNLLQEMANQYFTPETGIPVKIDLVPREELVVLSNATGKAPDVAIGMSEGKPVEFAVRGAAVDLSTYPGYEEVHDQFAPGALLPYYFDGGNYALPETQSFKVLYYRKDILERLGLEVPDTWEDVIDMLPTLQQNNYNFFLPNQEYLTFIYQYGADFYTKDGMRTGLDTPEAFQAFKTITDFFSIYGIDRHVPSFYQHFRNGFMPIGISDFNMYLQMTVAAPELHGWWDMAPIPGVMNDEGVVERWSGGNLGMLSQGLGGFGGSQLDSGAGGQTATMMFENSQNKDEGWQFIKWWLSAETQERFGMDLEGYYGIEFRWNTANLEAFTKLPWTHEELDVLLEQWRWYKALMIIPGSYFIPRELMNAWNRTILSGENYRSSLEEAVTNINREIYRKSVEFDYRDSQGNIIKTYDPPQIIKPWEGVDRYVR